MKNKEESTKITDSNDKTEISIPPINNTDHNNVNDEEVSEETVTRISDKNEELQKSPEPSFHSIQIHDIDEKPENLNTTNGIQECTNVYLCTEVVIKKEKGLDRNVVEGGEPINLETQKSVIGPYHQTCQVGYAFDYDEDYYPSFGESFLRREMRHQFVQRVYTILAVLLTCTFAFVLAGIKVEALNKFLLQDILLLILSVCIIIGLGYVIWCFESVRRSFPSNFIILAIYTTAYAYLLASISVRYAPEVVMLACLITAAVVCAISLFACQTKFDITGYGVYIFITVSLISLLGFVAVVVYMYTRMKLIYTIYAGLMSLVLCVCLMYDTQLIIGGRRHELSCEEYIAGALILYEDIVLLFIYILQILDSGN